MCMQVNFHSIKNSNICDKNMNLDLIGCKNLIFILSYTQHLGIQMVMIF